MVPTTLGPMDSRTESSCEGTPPILKLVGISKEFPGVLALDAVDFDLRPGEVHILFGENGAGKSTLISLVAGAGRPTAGEIHFRGEAVRLDSVHHARSLGISAVFQEFSLIPQMTVEENIFLGSEETRRGILQKKDLRKSAAEILRNLGFPMTPNQKVGALTRAEQQMVEIAKAFRSALSILILDEPTASLTERETEQLFKLIAQLKADGVGVIYITHRMNEIQRIGDRITVLRDGQHIATIDAKTASEGELIHLMTGRVISEIFPSIRFEAGEEILSAENLTTADGTVRGASINVRRGEIVGLAGLVGSGKSEIARACFGLSPIADGSVIFKGENTAGLGPREMLERGFFYLPPDRREEGLCLMQPCRENIALPALERRLSRWGFLKRAEEKKLAESLAARLNLTPPKIEQAVEHFSGGNQQKVMLSKSLTCEIDLFAFDEPTVGVDVGTRATIYQFIRELCEQGAAVILISSDLSEVIHLSNRLFVFYRGEIRAELAREEISEERVLVHFFERKAA